MFEFDTVRAMTLFVSGSCNLNCSYCYIHKNPALKIIDKEIKDAWETGEYLKTVKKVFDKMHAKLDNVTAISLWGGESTLHLKSVNSQLEDLYSLCPHINNIGFSSNFMCGIDDTIDFVKKVNEVAKVPQRIWLQQSIDGPTGVLMEKGHSGDWNTYRDNYHKLAEFFNNTALKNIQKININMKPTVDKDLFLDYFTDTKNLYDYIKFLNETYVEIKNLFVNSKISFGISLPKPSTPMTYSTEDACKLKQIMGNWMPIVRKYFDSLPEGAEKCSHLLTNLYTYIPTYDRNARLFPQGSPGCYKNISELAILPDGTLTDCTSNYMLGREDYENEASQEDKIVSKLYKCMNYNPLKLSDDDLEDALWLNVVGLKFNQSLANNFSTGLIREMALANQLPNIYIYNPDELLKASTFIQQQANCTVQQILTTRIPFLMNAGSARMNLIGIFNEFFNKNSRSNKDK